MYQVSHIAIRKDKRGYWQEETRVSFDNRRIVIVSNRADDGTFKSRAFVGLVYHNIYISNPLLYFKKILVESRPKVLTRAACNRQHFEALRNLTGLINEVTDYYKIARVTLEN